MNLHLVSDATGETLNAVTRASVAQFEDVEVTYHRWSLIRTRFQLHRVISGIEADPGPVLSTLVDKGLRTELETVCQKHGLPLVHVLDPVLELLQEQLGEKAIARPGRQYLMNADYFRRIDAMHFVLAHDDGQAGAGIQEADVVLVGVSRSSKTPTCFYLANRGIKAANVPLVPNIALPPELEEPHCPVIGLMIDPNALVEIRRHRLRMIHGGREENARVRAKDGGSYVDADAVTSELKWARKVCLSHSWPIIDVTNRSIEETAATVMRMMEAWYEHHKIQHLGSESRN